MKQFGVDLSLLWIQAIRLTHALTETDYQVHIPVEHEDKFSHLKKIFNIQYVLGVKDVPILTGLEVKHEGLPLTRVGSIECPLIFAHGAFDLCRNLWADDRPFDVSFAGRLHYDRNKSLQRWLDRNYQEIKIPEYKKIDHQIAIRKKRRRLRDRFLTHIPFELGFVRKLIRWATKVPPVSVRVESDGLVLLSSDRGWAFPTKAWDEQYFELMGQSKFVLCPDGWFTWTYRFFEAAMCGAIPIIENSCSLYDGFRFYTMNDDLINMQWNRNYALHNYNICKDLISVPIPRLDSEIRELIKRPVERSRAYSPTTKFKG